MSEAKRLLTDNPPEWAHGALLADGFEDALIGYGTRFNYPVAVYDYERCIAILEEQFRLSDDEPTDDEERDYYLEAVEYFDFNVGGGYYGDSTPVFIRNHD
jgi:hypothetical protein